MFRFIVMSAMTAALISGCSDPAADNRDPDTGLCNVEGAACYQIDGETEGICCDAVCLTNISECAPAPGLAGPVKIFVTAGNWNIETNELEVVVNLVAEKTIGVKWISVYMTLPGAQAQLVRFRAESFEPVSASGAEQYMVSQTETTYVANLEELASDQSSGTSTPAGDHTYKMTYKLPFGSAADIVLTPHCVKVEGVGEVTLGHGDPLTVSIPAPTKVVTQSKGPSSPAAFDTSEGRAHVATVIVNGTVGTSCDGFHGENTSEDNTKGNEQCRLDLVEGNIVSDIAYAGALYTGTISPALAMDGTDKVLEFHCDTKADTTGLVSAKFSIECDGQNRMTAVASAIGGTALALPAQPDTTFAYLVPNMGPNLGTLLSFRLVSKTDPSNANLKLRGWDGQHVVFRDGFYPDCTLADGEYTCLGLVGPITDKAGLVLPGRPLKFCLSSATNDWGCSVPVTRN